MSWKSGSLKLLKPYGPHRACYGTPLRFLLSLTGLCNELITRLEKSYRLWCVVMCDVDTSWMRRPRPRAVAPKPNKLSLISRSQWPRGLRRRSVADRLLKLWVRIPPRAWMSVRSKCCVLSDRGLCDELITRPEESYRLRCVVYDLETSWIRGPWPTEGAVVLSRIRDLGNYLLLLIIRWDRTCCACGS